MKATKQRKQRQAREKTWEKFKDQQNQLIAHKRGIKNKRARKHD
ncbi:hypothetical protein [Lactobacillus selangorensis]|nr:hypothetical protein [Lactobacillus selangorensis]